MRPEQRIVSRLPLAEIWDDQGPIASVPVRQLGEHVIRELLRVQSVQFLVADCGKPIRWISKDDTFEFWKTVRMQIVEPGQMIVLERFPHQTAYTASEWQGRSGECLVLLESHH